MRMLNESVLGIWKARQASVRAELAQAQRTADAIQQKLDRLDEAFLFQRSIDIETYDRHAERLREELTLARIAKHSTELDELDVEGILAFAERVLPRAADLWVQAPLDQRRRFQQLFFPEGMAFDGQRFVGTEATAPDFSYLRELRAEADGVASRSAGSGNARGSRRLPRHRCSTVRSDQTERSEGWWTKSARIGTAQPSGCGRSPT